nr:YceI family protein [uncultured Roseovarius sp.]
MFARIAATVLALTLTVQAAFAAPQPYRLDIDRSEVRFTIVAEGSRQSGVMPVKAAKMLIDLDNVPASKVDVTLDAAGARMGAFFLTQTMKGPEVLDTARFPNIRFRSTRILGDLAGARISGDLTIRDVTLPVTLEAGLYRQRGTPEGSRDKLTVMLTGTVSRAAFGADGFSGFVGDQIDLRIIVQIER